MLAFDVNIYNNHTFIIIFDEYIKICSKFLVIPKASCEYNGLAFQKQSSIYNVVIKYIVH
jgi:hypothetical protein